MNKRITAILFCLVVALTMMAAIPTFAVDATPMTVKADTATADRGDTIEFTVYLGAVDNMGTLQFNLIIPDGLTIKDDSIVVPEGLEEVIDSDGAIIVPAAKNNYVWSYSAQMDGYTGDSDLLILTFACTVDDDCAYESKDVTILVECFDDNENLESMPYTVKGATVAIAAPTQAPTAEPTTVPVTDASGNSGTFDNSATVVMIMLAIVVLAIAAVVILNKRKESLK